MPAAAEFLAGFGLVYGLKIDDYILTTATSTHESIKRYQEYAYSITLIFSGRGNYDNLFRGVENIISQQHIIYGIKNPYLCVIDPPQHGDIIEDVDGRIIFHLTGHGYRQ